MKGCYKNMGWRRRWEMRELGRDGVRLMGRMWRGSWRRSKAKLREDKVGVRI